jgi:hypothetical protein
MGPHPSPIHYQFAFVINSLPITKMSDINCLFSFKQKNFTVSFAIVELLLIDLIMFLRIIIKFIEEWSL